MVVSAKDKVRAEFGKRLSGHLDRLGIKPRGHINFVLAAMKKANNEVSYETCRKWVRGIEIPDEANLIVLSRAVSANPMVLRYGVEHGVLSREDDGSGELMELWADLDNEDRNHVLKAARLASQAKNSKKAKRA